MSIVHAEPRLTPGQISQTLDLLRLVFGDVDRAREDFFRWQNQANPAGPSLLRLAHENDRVIGRSALIPKAFWDGSREIRILEWVDSVTHPEHRGRGVFLSLARALHELAAQSDFAASYAMCYPQMYALCTDRLSCKGHGDLPLLMFPLRWEKLLRAKGFPTTLKHFFKPFFRVPGCMGGNVREQEHVDERFDDFWQSIRSGYRGLLVRDRKYLHWRYKELSGRHYRIAVAEKDGRMQGFCVFRATGFAGLQLGLLVDLLVARDGGEEQTAKDLVRYTRDALREAGADIVLAYFSKNSVPYVAAKQAGFFHCPGFLSPKSSRIISRSYDAESRWHFADMTYAMGDFDFG